jgi:hypothetical protein
VRFGAVNDVTDRKLRNEVISPPRISISDLYMLRGYSLPSVSNTYVEKNIRFITGDVSYGRYES